MFAAHAAEQFAQQEAESLRLTDEFAAHDDREARDAFAAQLARRKDVERAYIVEKIIPGVGGRTQPVLVVFNRLWGFQARQPQDLVNKLLKDLTFPKRTRVYVPADFRKWRKKLDAVPGALLYDRKS